MKKISLFLAMMLLISCCFAGLVGCAEEAASGENTSEQETTASEKREVTGALTDIVAAVDSEISITEHVNDVLYKADDDEDMMMLWYGVVDIPAADHLIDYVVTSPSSETYQTFALFVFDDEMTQEDYDEVREIVKETYMETRASSLQMYFPEEYAIMSWAIENQDLVWRQYDNALALIINGDEEATAAWNAFEAAALK